MIAYRLLLGSISLLLSAAWGLAQTTSTDIGGKITADASSSIALAVPPVLVGPGASATAAAEIAAVLRDDLDFSGAFTLLDPQGEGRIAAAQLNDPKAWGAVGARAVALLGLSLKNDRAILAVKLHETKGGEILLDRQLFGRAAEDIRRLAHVAANAILEQLTGQSGVFLTRIAFVGEVGKGKEVFLMDYDGARVRRLTTTGTINLVPAWARDGRRIAFVSFVSKRPTFHLLDENGKIQSVKLAGGDLNVSPDFSPDGTKLAFTSDRDGNSEIYVYDLTSGSETRLTREGGIDTSPCWSPSGEEIAFTSDRSGSPQIYIMRADGSNLRRLTFQGNYNESAAWSPDGGRIAFMSRIDGIFQLLVYDLATGQIRQVTSGRGHKENPRWASNSRHLVFSSNMEGAYSIYTIRDDGKGLRRLTKGMAAYTPDWSPIQP